MSLQELPMISLYWPWKDDGAELDTKEGATKELGGGITTVAVVVIGLVVKVAKNELVVGAPIPPIMVITKEVPAFSVNVPLDLEHQTVLLPSNSKVFNPTAQLNVLFTDSIQ
jgi:hypothetical protein